MERLQLELPVDPSADAVAVIASVRDSPSATLGDAQLVVYRSVTDALLRRALWTRSRLRGRIAPSLRRDGDHYRVEASESGELTPQPEWAKLVAADGLGNGLRIAVEALCERWEGAGSHIVVWLPACA